LSPAYFKAFSNRLLALLQRRSDTPAIAGVNFDSLGRWV